MIDLFDGVQVKMVQVDVSIVSHLHGAMALKAIRALANSCQVQVVFSMRVWLTLNVPEPELAHEIMDSHWPFDLKLIHNQIPLGFGENHNRAFGFARKVGVGQWFLVLNPDVFFPAMAGEFWGSFVTDEWPQEVGLVCPRQVDTKGQTQDFARKIITPWGQLLRVVRRVFGLQVERVAASVAAADWVNGACMIWRTKAFEAVSGFDERYFMYCEDADICLRTRLKGWRMAGVDLTVVHDAQRSNLRSSRHLRWHLGSLLRFWTSRAFWQYLCVQQSTNRKK